VAGREGLHLDLVRLPIGHSWHPVCNREHKSAQW
jgi:hypothetical protein